MSNLTVQNESVAADIASSLSPELALKIQQKTWFAFELVAWLIDRIEEPQVSEPKNSYGRSRVFVPESMIEPQNVVHRGYEFSIHETDTVEGIISLGQTARLGEIIETKYCILGSYRGQRVYAGLSDPTTQLEILRQALFLLAQLNQKSHSALSFMRQIMPQVAPLT